MTRGARTPLLVLASLLAFAGNSLLCRVGLDRGGVDPATFTSVRLLSGALLLALLVGVRTRRRDVTRAGSWPSALALFTYAAAFSFAYRTLPSGTGALLLFSAVQVTMIGCGVARGERLCGARLGGTLLALVGMVGLLLPGWSAPDPTGAMLMLVAGVAWGIYSLRGAGGGDATAATAGNFVRTLPFAIVLSVLAHDDPGLGGLGFWCAVASGSLTSAVGYALWYAALPALRATTAATAQLSVPVLAALGGVLLLDEQMTTRLWLAGVAILGGIALVIRAPR